MEDDNLLAQHFPLPGDQQNMHPQHQIQPPPQPPNQPPQPTFEEVMVSTLRDLDQTMVSLRGSYNRQNLSEIVTPFNGENPKRCRDWIASIEKFAELHGETDDRRMCEIAYMTAREYASFFTERWMRSEEGPRTWRGLKENLLAHFSVVTDCEHAHDLLRKVRQGPTETSSFFAERIHRLAIDAYSETELNSPHTKALVQKQLVNYFIDGLNDPSIKFKLFRKAPADLNQALRIAREEQTVAQRFELRNPRKNKSYLQHRGDLDIRGEEPMEVDHVRKSNACHYCGLRGHFAVRCRQRLRDRGQFQNDRRHNRERQSGDNRQGYNRREVNLVDGDKRGRCYFCNALGHFKRDCGKFQEYLNSHKSQGRYPKPFIKTTQNEQRKPWMEAGPKASGN